MVAQDEFAHLRIHHFAPAAAAEDAVVARTGNFQVLAGIWGNAGAQIVGGLGLADAGDIVQLALNGQECGVLDVLRAHTLQLAFGVADIPGAAHQAEVLEHHADGLQVVGRIQVEHGVVFVVELAVLLGAGLVAARQALEVIVVAAGVAVGVHGHKAGVLQKAGVHAPTGTGVVVGHAVDDVVLKPLKAALHGQVVHRGGRTLGVDGAPHHGHGQRSFFAPAGHERDGRQHRHGGLAYADDVAVAIACLQVANEFLHVVDVVVQVKFALRQGNHAGVFPVGDIDLVVAQHAAHGIAQQGGVVAGQGGDDQHRGLAQQGVQRGGVVRKTLEAAQLAKGLVDFHALANGYVHPIDLHRLNAKLRLLVVFGQAVEQVKRCHRALGGERFGQGQQWVAVKLGGGLRKIGKGLKQGALRFVNVVQH